MLCRNRPALRIVLPKVVLNKYAVFVFLQPTIQRPTSNGFIIHRILMRQPQALFTGLHTVGMAAFQHRLYRNQRTAGSYLIHDGEEMDDVARVIALDIYNLTKRGFSLRMISSQGSVLMYTGRYRSYASKSAFRHY